MSIIFASSFSFVLTFSIYMWQLNCFPVFKIYLLHVSPEEILFDFKLPTAFLGFLNYSDCYKEAKVTFIYFLGSSRDSDDLWFRMYKTVICFNFLTLSVIYTSLKMSGSKEQNIDWLNWFMHVPVMSLIIGACMNEKQFWQTQ